MPNWPPGTERTIRALEKRRGKKKKTLQNNGDHAHHHAPLYSARFA